MKKGVESHKTRVAPTNLVWNFDSCNHYVVAINKKIRLQWLSILQTTYIFTQETFITLLVNNIHVFVGENGK